MFLSQYKYKIQEISIKGLNNDPIKVKKPNIPQSDNKDLPRFFFNMLLKYTITIITIYVFLKIKYYNILLSIYVLFYKNFMLCFIKILYYVL